MKNYQITSFVQHFIAEQVKYGDFCIDATAGNGNDTLFLCEQTGKQGKVFAFDIQEEALQNTKKRLHLHGYTAELILDSHVNLLKYVEKESVDCIVFNFGYLPKGNHDICTKADTSVMAIEAGLLALKKGGLMTLCIYSGQETGFEEKEAILQYIKTLDTKKYLVIASFYYNRPNNPPIPVLIRKL